MDSFWLLFIPLFIVLDAPGNLPIVISLTSDMTAQERNRVIHIAIITAFSIGLVFLFFGDFILKVLGIPLEAFTIAGGIIILTLAIKYMIIGHTGYYAKDEIIAVVPIGTPLVVGPATITTLMLLSQQYHLYLVLLAFSANMLICWLIFLLGYRIIYLIGVGGVKVISKVFSLLLAAIAIQMIINGLRASGIIG